MLNGNETFQSEKFSFLPWYFPLFRWKPFIFQEKSAFVSVWQCSGSGIILGFRHSSFARDGCEQIISDPLLFTELTILTFFHNTFTYNYTYTSPSDGRWTDNITSCATFQSYSLQLALFTFIYISSHQQIVFIFALNCWDLNIFPLRDNLYLYLSV